MNNVRKRCVKFTTLILSIGVGLILTGALFHEKFCSAEDVVVAQSADLESLDRAGAKNPKDSTKPQRPRLRRETEIMRQQTRIKRKLKKLDKKLDKIRSLKHGPKKPNNRSATKPHSGS